LKQQQQRPLEQALEHAVSRALRDNLVPLQRTADELQQAYADLVAACSSTRPSNALPAMLRAQTAASALAAGLSVLSNFVAVALKPREPEDGEAEQESGAAVAVAEPEVEEEAPAPARHEEPASVPEAEIELSEAKAEEPTVEIPVHTETVEIPVAAEPEPQATESAAAFEVSSLSTELQDLHRRANRVAKVAMQDIKLLRPKDVRLGRENKDICVRLRADIDKARKEYDRRFRAIQDHPVDYFHHWMVEILGEGNSETLGEYPYPSPVLRH
jgi:hypothetical protein